MKKPTKAPQTIRRESFLIELWNRYSPKDLRDIADQMDAESISFIEFDQGYSHTEVYEHKLESELEAEVRYTKEMKKYNTFLANSKKKKEKEKLALIKKAKALGLKVEE